MSAQVRPGYKLTEVGVYPEDWLVCELGDLAPYVTSGSRGWAEYYSDRGDPFVRITNLSRATIYIDQSDLKRVRLPANDNEGLRTALVDGDLLISITADIGIIGYVDSSLLKPAYINQHIALVRFNNYDIDSKYLSYFLAGENTQRSFRGSTDQGAKAGINLAGIRAIKAALPSIFEQRAIATALSDMDALISGLDQLIAKKRDIKQAAMQQLLTGQQRLPGFSGEWEVKRLGDVLEKIVGGGTPSRSNENYWRGEIPWVTVKDFATFSPRVAQETITQEGLKNSASNLIPRKTLITSTRMALGKAVIYEVDVSINQDLKALFPKPNICTKFLYYWFENNATTIDELGSGSTVKGISLGDLKAITFLLSSLEEQTAIANTLSDMDSELATLKTRRDKTHQLKQGMMQELLTGKTRLI